MVLALSREAILNACIDTGANHLPRVYWKLVGQPPCHHVGIGRDSDTFYSLAPHVCICAEYIGIDRCD